MSNLNVSSPKSTSEWACNALRQAILTQQLAPGERLVEARVAQQLNISITPVRAAFSILAAEGLLDIQPFRSTNVTEITRKYVIDTVDVRKSLESTAACLSFPLLSDTDIEKLRRYSSSADRQYADKNQLFEALDNDISFHSFFFEKCGNDLLLKIWNTMKPRIRFIQIFTKQSSRIERAPGTGHRVMIDAVAERDIKGFLAGLSDHLENTLQFVKFEEKTGSA